MSCGRRCAYARSRTAAETEPAGVERGGSEYVHLYLRPGRTLEVSLPRNHFPLRPAPEYLFLAGGIGITPIVPMLRAAVDAGADARLVYVGRSPSTMPFAAE